MTKKINNKIIDKNISDNLSLVGIVIIENGKNKVMGRNHWVGQGLETIGGYLVGGAGNGAASNIYIGSDTIVPTTVSMTGLIVPIGSAPGTGPNTFNASYSINISSTIPATVVYTAVWNPGTVSGTLGEVGLYLHGYGGLSGSTYATNPGLAARIAVADGTLTPFVINPIDALTISWFVYFAYSPKTFVTESITSTQGNITQTAVSITNSQNTPVPAGLQVVWQVPVSTLQTYFSQFNVNLNSNLSNMRILYNGQYIPAWIESINNGTATIWMQTPVSIPANSSIGLSLYADSSLNFDGVYWGEAPQLSPTYGQYDNGASVFNNYWNFAGTSLPSSLTETVLSNPSGASGSYSVNNGITISNTNGIDFWSSTVSSDYMITLVYDTSTISVPSVVQAQITSLTGNSGDGGWTKAGILYQNSITASSNSNGEVYMVVTSGNGYQFGYQSGTSYVAPSQASNGGSITYPTDVSLLFQSTSNVGGFYGSSLGSLTQMGSYVTPTSIASSGYIGLFVIAHNSAGTSSANFRYLLTRAYPPNGVMPTVSIL